MESQQLLPVENGSELPLIIGACSPRHTGYASEIIKLHQTRVQKWTHTESDTLVRMNSVTNK